MKYTTIKIHLKGTDRILGSQPMDKEIYTNFIKGKCKTDEERDRATEDTDDITNEDEKGVTGFFKDKNDGHPFLKGYQIKGFLKEAGNVLKDQLGLAAAKSKIDNFVFIMERNIPFTRDGKVIEGPDGFLERPLRGETAQGPRVFLAKSEYIEAGWECEFTVKILENKKTAKSIAITPEAILEMFDYGELKGLLQWRNAMYGAFTYDYEIVDNDKKSKTVKEDNK